MSGLYQRTSQSVGSLLDTDLTNPANDEVLTYEDELWKNKPAGGGQSTPVYASYIPSAGMTLGAFYTQIDVLTVNHQTAGISLNTSTGDITVADAGTYLIHADFMISNSSGDLVKTILGMWSGSTFKLRFSIHEGTFKATTLTGHAVVDLTAGETINFRVYASVSGGTSNLASYNSSQGIYITKIS